jgi:hypothetical protein
MRIASSLLLAALVLASIGCDAGDGPVLPSELEVGSANLSGDGFIEVVDGMDVELAPGAQGGFHVWLNLRVLAAEGELYVEREARRVSDDALILRGQPQFIEVPAAAMEDWWESPYASPAFMCPSPIGIKVFDEPIRYHVTLTNLDGEILAEDEVVLTPRCPVGEQAEFCTEICSG